MKKYLILSLLLSTSLYAQAQLSKAVVYGGYGACEDDCVTGAAEAAREAGFEPVIVYPDTFDPRVLDDAALWIQPGGKSVQSAQAMGKTMMSQIRNFIKNGGGYVGFCAGAFFSTSKIGTSGTDGLGITPGKTIVYKAQGYPTIEKMTLLQNEKEVSRQIYWEGGPYFILTNAEKAQVNITGSYARTAQVAAVRNTYGAGKVWVTGAHPEAPQWWRDSSNLFDKDGLDYDVTTEMIQWVAKKNQTTKTTVPKKSRRSYPR